MNIINKQSLGKCYCGVHENGHCSSGAGGELNCFGLVTVDRNRSRLWMWRVPISVGLWILRDPN